MEPGDTAKAHCASQDEKVTSTNSDVSSSDVPSHATPVARNVVAHCPTLARKGSNSSSGSSAVKSSHSAEIVWDYLLFPLALPLLCAYWVLAFIMAWMLTLLVFPSVLVARRLYWSCPFIPFIFKQMGPVKGWATRIGFESSYSINVWTRMLTLPMRRSLPHFMIVGFPKCGTTALAEHLKTHPGISGTTGLPYHEALSKESHYFEGVFGRDAAHSATLYRSFFPCIMQKWWIETVKRVPNWMCFDACPVHACLPYVARRIAAINPDCKIVVMLRDPVAGVFSAETMLADMGVPLGWQSLAEPLSGPADERFKSPGKEEAALWDRVAALKVQDPLPDEMPRALYMTLGGVLRCGQYVDLLQPYLTEFPAENIMVINFSDWRSDTEGVVRDVLRFVGASEAHYTHQNLPVAMQNQYKGRAVHPTVATKLRAIYRPSIRRLQALLQRDLGWGVDDEDPGA